MPRRALLIGSETGGLTGVHSDVALMDSTLESLGFETRLAMESNATREAIISAFRELIGDARDGDAIVVYYSGHGGRYPNPLREQDPQAPPYLQFIVPTDYDDAPVGVFNGLLAEEISILQAELTSKTRNVTTILDCCHSARMSRDPSRLPRARRTGVDFPADAVSALYEEVRNAPAAQLIELDANPFAVRLVACAAEQSAYELDMPNGSRNGALTATLAAALSDAVTTELTWRQLLEAVRPAVMDLVDFQRPEFEGPTDRFLFRTDQRESTGVLPITIDANTPYLEAPAMFGVGEGDRFALVGVGEKADRALATAVIDDIVGSRARLALTDGDLGGRTGGLEAHPLRVALGRRPLAVESREDPDAELIVAALRESPHVRIVAADAPSLMATVSVVDGEIRLLDGQGELLQEAASPISEAALESLRRSVLQLARAAHLRDLPPGEGSAALPTDVSVDYLRVTPDGETPVQNGEHLFDGDRLVVRLRNTGSEPRYASVFDIGMAGAITLLSTAEPSGLTLAPGEDYELYRTPAGLTGIELYWPDGLPRGGPRPESVVTIVTDKRQDLTRLHQPGVSTTTRGDDVSALEQLVDAVTDGTRDARPPAPSANVVRYRVERMDFMLHPEARADDREPAFELDERPDPSFRVVVPRSAVAAPTRAAVRLSEVHVHSNRAWLRSAVRVDAMVLTRLDTEARGPAFQAATARFDRVRDGDRLPLDNLLLYEGPVAGFLDLAVWVARDDQRGLDLADLLAHELGRDDVKSALTAFAGLAVAAPQAALGVAAIAAVATLVRTGAAVLDAAVGQSIGVYRTSLLPHEGFGAGDPAARHPASGLLRAQDMSFAYEVIAG
jgi:hypothetical protein